MKLRPAELIKWMRGGGGLEVCLMAAVKIRLWCETGFLLGNAHFLVYFLPLFKAAVSGLAIWIIQTPYATFSPSFNTNLLICTLWNSYLLVRCLFVVREWHSDPLRASRSLGHGRSGPLLFMFQSVRRKRRLWNAKQETQALINRTYLFLYHVF